MTRHILLAIALCCAAAYAEDHAPTEAHKDTPHAGPAHAEPAAPAATKPSPGDIVKMLAEGNARFRDGKTLGPHRDPDRVKLAAGADQGNYALATILSCADSRVPLEVIFDAGVMDLFVVRVAGNVSDTDEVGTIEYGVAHVNTPLLVVMGHSGCGAVKAVAESLQGKGHPLEKNIPPLVDNIAPAVQRAMRAHPEAKDAAVVPFAVEENVWQSMRDLFKRSAAVRKLVSENKVGIVGAVYDLPTGEVRWLDSQKPLSILAAVEKDPKRSMEVMAGEHAPAAGEAPTPAEAPHSAPETGEAPKPNAETPTANAEAPKPPSAPRPEVPVQMKGEAHSDAHDEKH